MVVKRFRAEALIEFGKDVLVRAGFPEKQAQAAAMILVEADLRGDHAHGIAGGVSLAEYIERVNDDEAEIGFKRIEIADYSLDEQKYPTVITVDAHGGLGRHAALEVIPRLIEAAKKYGCAKAYIRNSNHFGDCGIYSERIAEQDPAAKVTCTSPAWAKPFIELCDVILPLNEAKQNLRRSAETTLQCGNELMYLPGQKEQATRRAYLAQGIPMTAERIQVLKKTAADPRINLPFSLSPIIKSREF